MQEAIDFGLVKMISDELESGALENAKTLFRYNKELWMTLGNLLGDERMKVRLGASILIEDLIEEKPEFKEKLAPQILPLLEHEIPTIRGDAAYIIGLLGNPDLLDHLKPLLKDENPQVVEIVVDAIKEIERSS